MIQFNPTAAHLTELPFQIIKLFDVMTHIPSIKIIVISVSILFLQSCGTARGILYGTGTVLEGVATDVRSVGNWIN